MRTKKIRGRSSSSKIVHHEPLDGGEAFLPDLARVRAALSDDEAEAFAEEMIATATSGEYMAEDARDEMTVEELGGPFIEHAGIPFAGSFALAVDDDL